MYENVCAHLVLRAREAKGRVTSWIARDLTCTTTLNWMVMFLLPAAVFRIQKQEIAAALVAAPRAPRLPPAVRIGLRCHANHGLEDAMEVETAHACAAGQHIERWRGITAFDQPARRFDGCGVPRADRRSVRTASLAWTIAGSFRRRAVVEEADVLPSRQPSTAAGPAIHSRGQNGANERSVGAAITPQDCLPTLVVSREGRRIGFAGFSLGAAGDDEGGHR